MHIIAHFLFKSIKSYENKLKCDRILFGEFMKIIRSIDLWTEQKDNQAECFNGAFIDGFEKDEIPFDSYKIIKNCNCAIVCNDSSLNITNKHQAIVFYKDNVPVRLMVVNKNTNIDGCINTALRQEFRGTTLGYLFELLKIERKNVDLKEDSILNLSDHNKEVDVGSCDRQGLLDSMLEGSYTESDTGLGKNNIETEFTFIPEIYIKYAFMSDDEIFNIEHHCAFINKDGTRIIPLQDNSYLNIEEIRNNYYSNDSKKHM